MTRIESVNNYLNDVKRNTGIVTDCIFANFTYQDKKIAVTYDCKSDNLIIHEWYNIPEDKLGLVEEKLKKCFREMR